MWMTGLDTILFNMTLYRLYDEEDWLLWEHFGVAEKAMSQNALLYLGRNSCPFSELRRGAVTSHQLKGTVINLEPASIFRSNEPLAIDTQTIVSQYKRPEVKKTWTNGKLIVMNGSNGEGIDIWSRVPIHNSKSFLLELDSRKREAKKLTTKVLERYYSKAKSVIPTICNQDQIAVGIISVASEFDDRTPLPEDCYVVSRSQIKDYFGIFANHPIVWPYVNVNDPLMNQSWIQSTLSGKTTEILSEFSRIVVEERRKGPFKDESDLKSRVKNTKKMKDADVDKIKVSKRLMYHWY